MIDELKSAGLFGAGLVPVSGALARRYNGCLELLGIAPTSLERFHIDAMGWSPEIAEEKEHRHYLNPSEANTHAIIVSPQQEDKPVYYPFHSFDADLMTAVFAAYRKEIRDITKDSALCLDIDQFMDSYFEPLDLLRYQKVEVRFQLLNDLQKKQTEQRKLVEKFQDGNHFIDTQLHHQLLDSARTYGDLRNRKLDLEPLTLQVRSFYTKAFGGVFLLRDFITDIMVFESEEMFKKAIKDTAHEVTLFHINHTELTTTLVNHVIAEFDIRKAAKTPRYERIKKHLFVQKLTEWNHPLQEILDSPFIFKRYLNELDETTQKELLSVERYNQRKIVERDLNINEVVAPVYSKALLEPHSSLEEEHTELVWTLLTKLTPIDPLHLYWYDKETFYSAFPTWPESYRKWVIESVLNPRKPKAS
ncbi:DUF6638 family protein [Altibacter sp. HG106]|uniref:DUF6638 family protein n=1 Tax=Altibacter sp. HG106 TaxID=3023937 RepID=UPI002350BE17|nr:DUF6638 family protein [Altibacter sp. HG106]MDC7995920.1 hypothetical protein [Altibacter sp. HG106]